MPDRYRSKDLVEPPQVVGCIGKQCLYAMSLTPAEYTKLQDMTRNGNSLDWILVGPTPQEERVYTQYPAYLIYTTNQFLLDKE